MSKFQFTVEARPHYIVEQSAPQQAVYSFSYTITVHNVGEVAAQLISRHWIITDSNGHTEEVKGLGVVGQQPMLRPGESFQYSSGCRLRTPSGAMRGSYFCVTEAGERFDVEIPAFILDADDAAGADGSASQRVLH
jgi:ApaG protein